VLAALALCAPLLTGGALAQTAAQTAAPAAPAIPPIPYPDAATALAALQARDGDGVIVTHPEGWVVASEPLASAQWSFTTPGHEAHPAAVRRVIRRERGGGVTVQVDSLCTAGTEPCARLVAQFEAMNERITQSVKARGRQGSTPPAQP
jgi:hypothetical protein